MTSPTPRPIRLGVNIDHVATLRNARGAPYPDPFRAALLAAEAGADGITAHLREDRRHIRDADVERLATELPVPLNMEMAVTDEMVAIARRLRPHAVCLVPERREEVTTEGGLDAARRRPEARRGRGGAGRGRLPRLALHRPRGAAARGRAAGRGAGRRAAHRHLLRGDGRGPRR